MESLQDLVLRDRPVKLSELLKTELLCNLLFGFFSINVSLGASAKREIHWFKYVCAVFFPFYFFLSCHCPVGPGLGLC